MSDLSKDEKKALMKKWKAEQNKKYILNKTKVKKLFAYLENKLDNEPCDHTMKHTENWILGNCNAGMKDAVMKEINKE